MVHVNSYMQLPVDGGGKKVRSVQTTIGSDNVHEEYVISIPFDYQIINIYSFCSAALTVGSSADAANVGRVYVENDPDSTVIIAVRKVRFICQLGSALATPTGPLITLRRFTFTGNTPSGAAVGNAIMDTDMTAKDSNWHVRSAATGMTITESSDFAAFHTVSGATAVGYTAPATDEWISDPMYPLILRAGQGMMVKQAESGTAADTRRFGVTIEVAEIVPVTVS